MATLIGNEELGFELNLGQERSEAGQRWLDYSLTLMVNGRKRNFANSDELLVYGKFSFNLSERDELAAFKEQLKHFLEDTSKRELFFEPADPSFELRIERTKHSAASNQLLALTEEEFKVYIWIDAGNSTRLHYSWDAEGLRFLATKTQILQFHKSL